MNKNTKRILIILIVAIFVCIVGAAAAIGGIGLMAERFKDNITMDTEKIQTMAHAFVNYDLPPNYTEQIGMDFLLYKMVLIGETGNTGASPMIFLAHFQDSRNMSPEQMSEQMQQSAEQQSGRKGVNLKVIETRNVTINGKETKLTVSEGEDGNGEIMRQWISTFPGKSGFIILLIQGSTENWDDAVFNEFLASIRD